MSAVEQLDLFEYLQEIENQSSILSGTAVTEPANGRVPFWSRLGNALSWFWIALHNVFGLAQWVNVYTVTRGYGGREVGGWYYLKYECLKSRQVGFWEADVQRIQWMKQYTSSHKWGDLYSKQGGQDVVVRIESRRAESRTNRPPRYEAYADQAISYALIKGGI